MHISGKIMIPLGLVILILGVAMMVLGVGKGVEDLSGLEDYGFSVENATSGTIEIEDNDGEGDVGVTFWVEGEYVDEDENGIWDVCDDTNITITQHPAVNTDWSEEYDGGFYYTIMSLTGLMGARQMKMGKTKIMILGNVDTSRLVELALPAIQAHWNSSPMLQCRSLMTTRFWNNL